MREIGRHSFVDRVRNGKLKAPTQPGFSAEKWTRTYLAIESPSVSEERLYESGIWFSQKLEQIRTLLINFEDITIPSDRTIQAHVGTANSIVLSKMLEHQDEIESSLQGDTAEPRANLFLPGAFTNVQFSSWLEGFVVSLRFPFGDAIRESRQPVEGEAFQDIEVLAKIQIRLQAGAAYDLLYYLWNECLWNDWFVDTSRDIDMVAPSDMSLAITRAIGERRWLELGSELFIRIGMEWQRRTPAERIPFVSMPRITDLVQEAGQQRIVTGVSEATSPHAPVQLVTQLASTELYLGDLLSMELPNFPGLSLRHLSSAWAALAPLADIVTDRFPEPGYVNTLNQVIEYCPTFERSQLEDVLAGAMRITAEQAEQIMDLLTFSGNLSEELWLRPFVHVDEATVAVLTSALRGPNLLRSIEQWMKVGGLDLDSRGGAFERVVRERLARTNKLSTFEIVPRPLTFRIAGNEEEIDLVARVGPTILVGEVKCSIHPTEPMEIYRYFDDRLRSGAAQAARKAEFIRENFEAFVNQAGFTGIREEDATVIPLVLTNLALGVGWSIGEVPVVDLLILQRFIDNGLIRHKGYFDQEGNFVAETEEHAYASESEAAIVLKDYLENPPQLNVYKSQLLPVPMDIPPISNNDKPALYVNWVSAGYEDTAQQ